MKIVCISDTHQFHRSVEVPEGDVLVHAGDMTNHGSQKALADFNSWLGELPHKHKLVIAGNHDFCFQKQRAICEKLLTNATYLQDSGVEIDGVKFWGAPWSNEFNFWAFMRNEHGLRHYWSLIPDDTEVLITHGPAFGMLDEVSRETGLHVGSKTLLNRIVQLKSQKLRLFVCGHIHEGYGMKASYEEDFRYVNASTCDESYRPTNKPIVVDL